MCKPLLSLAAALTLMATAPAPVSNDSIDAIAREYVVLALEVKQLEPDWIEAPEVPPELQKEAAGRKADPNAIIEQSSALIDRLDRIPVPARRLDAERYEWLRASLVSLRMQLQVKQGKKWPVVEEVALRYGFKPDFRPLSEYDPILARLDKQLSGPGTLTERITRLQDSASIPADKVQAVQDAAFKECRRRAAEHVTLPKGDSVERRWVTDPLFAGNNTYKGNGHSLAEFSSQYKWKVDQLLWVTCHEIYPGHHTHFAIRSAALRYGRNWPEFGIDQNYGPVIPAAEAVAESGVGLTFPIEDRIKFERDVLYPLAGLKMSKPDEWRAYWTGKFDMLGATASVAQLYLDGKLSKNDARQAFIKYRMMTPDGADKMLPIVDQLGSYVIASDVGWMTIDRRLRARPLAEQWKAFNRVLSEPMTVKDLQGL